MTERSISFRSVVKADAKSPGMNSEAINPTVVTNPPKTNDSFKHFKTLSMRFAP